MSEEYSDDPAAAAAVVEHHTGQAAGAILNAAQELRAAWNITSAMASARDPDAE